MAMLGAMQEFPLRIMRILDHAEREHGPREIVAARADGTTHRTNWLEIAHDSRRLAQALVRMGVQPGDRVATLAMNHDRHLVAWFGVPGMGGVLHTVNPRLFDDQLEYIVNHAEDCALLCDAALESGVHRMKPKWTSSPNCIRFNDQSHPLRPGEDGRYGWYGGDEREPCSRCSASGTKGNPEGVLYGHRSPLLHA